MRKRPTNQPPPQYAAIAVYPSVKTEFIELVHELKAEAPSGEASVVTHNLVMREMMRVYRQFRGMARNRREVYGGENE